MIASDGMDRIDDGRRPLDAMCNYIVERYHAALLHWLPRIADELTAIAAASPSPAARAMREIFAALEEEIGGHLAKEQHLVFPALCALAGLARAPQRDRRATFATVLHPIRLLESEHLRIERLLDRLRDVARTVEEPDSQSDTFRRCMIELAEFDRALREHHRIENEELFPAALELERQLL
jgi:regulator of cell morphogenesis and NO signaling